MNIRSFCMAVAAGFLAVTSGYAQTPSGSTPSPAASPTTPSGIADAASSAYVLGRDDVIEIGLLGRTDFAGRTRIQADGTIQLPLIGKVPVADRTTAEVSEAVRKSLIAGGFFSDPVVTVEVVGYASRYVTVLGAVGQPGLIPINRPYRISEILARVGGARDGAADHVIVRSDNGDERKLVIRDLATGGEEQVSVTRAGQKVKVDLASKVQPGDVLEIGERLF